MHIPIFIISVRTMDNTMVLGDYVRIACCGNDKSIKVLCPPNTKVEVSYKTEFVYEQDNEHYNSEIRREILDKIYDLSFHFDRCLRELKDALYRR